MEFNLSVTLLIIFLHFSFGMRGNEFVNVSRPEDNEIPSASTHSPKFAPYFDVNLKESPKLTEVYLKSGQKVFTLAFALGSYLGCEPKWGAANDIDDPEIIEPIRKIQAEGGDFIVATGGAAGPYLEHLCNTQEALVKGYIKVLDAVKTNHLDIDVEAPINLDILNGALAQLQKERPKTTVSFTLPVQGDDYGLTKDLGTDVLLSAKKHGVRVDIVNAMTMEYPSQLEWGESVIAAAGAVLSQIRGIWPEKSEGEAKGMLGVTPMLGRNFNGRMFELRHAKKLVEWANVNRIGLLAFWSIGRDNGKCPGGGVSPSCSSIAQNEYQFTKIFQDFK